MNKKSWYFRDVHAFYFQFILYIMSCVLNASRDVRMPLNVTSSSATVHVNFLEKMTVQIIRCMEVQFILCREHCLHYKSQSVNALMVIFRETHTYPLYGNVEFMLRQEITCVCVPPGCK